MVTAGHTIGEAARDVIVSLRQAADDPTTRSLPLPLGELTAALGSLRPREVTMLSGPPGHGKTALSNQIAFFLADIFRKDESDDQRQVAVFSLEMPRQSLVLRWLSSQIGVSLDALLNAQLKEENWTRLEEKAEALASLNLTIFDKKRQTTADINDGLYEIRKNGPVRYVVVDYFQLLTDGIGAMADHSRFDSIIESLKEISELHQCHILALSSLSNEGKIRGSRGIEYGADNVISLLQPALVDPDGDDSSIWRDVAKIDVTKHRNGPVGSYRLHWDGSRMQFTDPTDYEKQRTTGVRPTNSKRYTNY